jgi:hypothetical protein
MRKQASFAKIFIWLVCVLAEASTQLCAETYGRHGGAHGRQNLLNVTHAGSQTFVCSLTPAGECAFCHESRAKDYRELEQTRQFALFLLEHSAETYSYREAIRARGHDVVMRQVVHPPRGQHRVFLVSRLTILVVLYMDGVRWVIQGRWQKKVADHWYALKRHNASQHVTKRVHECLQHLNTRVHVWVFQI